jgi:hypothetical protein
MTSRRFGLVIFAAVLAAAAFSASTSASMTVRFKGPFTLAEFVQVDQTGCIVTDVVSTGASGRQSTSGEGTSSFEEVDAFVSIINTCDPTAQNTFLVCTSFPGTSADMNVDRRLTTGTASGTMTCTDLDSGTTCQMQQSETLAGVGDVRTEQSHFQDRSGNVMVNAVFRGRTRDAQVTDASVSGCGINMTEDDAVFGELEITSSVFVQVQHP